MPEPELKAVQGPQDDVDASTPQVSADKPTTVKTSEKSGQSGKATETDALHQKHLMDLLDIPPEVQKRIKAEAKPEKEPELPVQQPEKDEEPEELKPDEEEEEDEQPAAAEEKPDKRLKRINRLTRQKGELEAQLDAVASENYKLREAIQKSQAQEPGNHPAPLVGGNLPAIQNEIARFDATLEWCDNNAEGAEVGDGDKTQYYDAKAIRAWRRDSELKRQKFVVAEQKELERLSGVREQSDQQAIALWPEMFDRSKPEYQEAVAIIRKYPFIASIPEANYALGLFIEASRSLKAKAKNGANGAPKQHRDIDERVFTTPRAPIAPSTPEPPSRESKQSSPQKTYNEAMSRLTKDTDGSVESLANVFSALEATQRTRPGPRSPVKS